MTWWQAALWGLAGGGAASLVSLSAAIKAAGFHWPWRENGELGPQVFVMASGLVLGALVAAAAHSQVSGPWPAFIFGIGAPATIRGVLSGVEVSPRPPVPGPRRTRPIPQGQDTSAEPALLTPEEEVHEDTR